MEINISELTDSELAELQLAVDSERGRRATIAQASASADALAQTYQSAVEFSLAEGKYLNWERPTGAHNAYYLGQKVSHEGKVWTSNLPANVVEPGLDGAWSPEVAEGEYPIWYQPLGTAGMYQIGDIVMHDTKLWISERADNVWEPGVQDSGWVEYSDTVPDPEPTIPAWKQPTGAHDAYYLVPTGSQLGPLVTHEGQTWKTTVNANTYEPGVYGWVVVP